MGAASLLTLLLTHPFEFRTLLQYKLWHEPKRDITEPSEFATSGWDRPSMRRCWEFLDETSRSFSGVIKELEGDLARVVRVPVHRLCGSASRCAKGSPAGASVRIPRTLDSSWPKCTLSELSRSTTRVVPDDRDGYSSMCLSPRQAHIIEANVCVICAGHIFSWHWYATLATRLTIFSIGVLILPRSPRSRHDRR